jgi:hypothetical protein
VSARLIDVVGERRRNIQLARRCIYDLNLLNIKSDNVPFRRGTSYKCSDYHSFVLSATRCETVGIPDLVQNRRRQVLSLLADDTRTKEQRRAAVKARGTRRRPSRLRWPIWRTLTTITSSRTTDRRAAAQGGASHSHTVPWSSAAAR